MLGLAQDPGIPGIPGSPRLVARLRRRTGDGHQGIPRQADGPQGLQVASRSGDWLGWIPRLPSAFGSLEALRGEGFPMHFSIHQSSN